MIDINLIRTNPDLVRENIKKKFQDQKLPYVDEVIKLDAQIRELKKEGDNLRAQRNTLSSQIGQLMREKNIEKANEIKAQVVANNEKLVEIEKNEEELSAKLKKIMMSIPNIIADDVPIGKDDSQNVEILVQKSGRTAHITIIFGEVRRRRNIGVVAIIDVAIISRHQLFTPENHLP